ncbi:hypothetical protein DFJ73DRAFT_96097 [Zopfochytrium polystomum]|nr:hypothetical protein DFJ73DRAFT_96097 [Zopfochytrium polystomum]
MGHAEKDLHLNCCHHGLYKAMRLWYFVLSPYRAMHIRRAHGRDKRGGSAGSAKIQTCVSAICHRRRSSFLILADYTGCFEMSSPETGPARGQGQQRPSTPSMPPAIVDSSAQFAGRSGDSTPPPPQPQFSSAGPGTTSTQTSTNLASVSAVPGSSKKTRTCRNVIIHGFCKFENQGCEFNHDPV